MSEQERTAVAAKWSLLAAIAGFAVAALAAKTVALTVWGLLFLVLELVALVTGRIGRKHPAGKAGLIISSIALVVIVGAAAAAWFWLVKMHR